MNPYGGQLILIAGSGGMAPIRRQDLRHAFRHAIKSGVSFDEAVELMKNEIVALVHDE